MTDCPVCGLPNDGALGARPPRCVCSSMTKMKAAETATVKERERLYFDVMAGIHNDARLAERKELLGWIENWDKQWAEDTGYFSPTLNRLITELKAKLEGK